MSTIVRYGTYTNTRAELSHTGAEMSRDNSARAELSWAKLSAHLYFYPKWKNVLSNMQ